MSDFNSSLPVRTENPGDVIAKIADATTPSQQLAIDASGRITAKMDDGAGNALTSQVNGTQQALDVGINVAGIQIDPRDTRFLASGTDSITAFQGTSPWITKDGANGPVTPGTVASFSELIGGQYNTALPTLTNGQQSAIQVDSSGRLLVTSSSTDDHNYGTVGANTLRTAAQIGNATGAADFNAGATGAQTLRVAANQGAPNTNANGWFVRLTDGTDNVTVTAAGELNTIATAQPGVDIGDVTVNNGAGAAAVNIQDGGNSITVDGTVTASNFPTTVDTNYGTVGANTIRTAAQIGNATGAADFGAGATTAQTLRTTSNQGTPNTIANAWPTLLTDGTDTVAVNTDGSINVVITDSTPGTPINDYKRAVAIAAGASDNHDYTVTAGKTLYLNQLESSASGKAKMQVDIETGVATGVFLTKWSQFNSTASPQMGIHIDNPIAVAAGVRVRLVMTNKDLLAEDMYSTISGYELP